MSSHLTRNAPSISQCWMPQRIRDQLAEMAQNWAPLEVGGVLAGYLNGDAAVITDLVGPGDRAEHQRFHFAPDYDFHVREIARLYAASAGVTIYLGDWHSHPNGLSLLSPVDCRTLRGIAEAPEAQCSRPLMVLLSGGRENWSVKVFTLGSNRPLRPRQVIGVELCVY